MDCERTYFCNIYLITRNARRRQNQYQNNAVPNGQQCAMQNKSRRNHFEFVFFELDGVVPSVER